MHRLAQDVLNVQLGEAPPCWRIWTGLVAGPTRPGPRSAPLSPTSRRGRPPTPLRRRRDHQDPAPTAAPNPAAAPGSSPRGSLLPQGSTPRSCCSHPRPRRGTYRRTSSWGRRLSDLEIAPSPSRPPSGGCPRTLSRERGVPVPQGDLNGREVAAGPAQGARTGARVQGHGERSVVVVADPVFAWLGSI